MRCYSVKEVVDFLSNTDSESDMDLMLDFVKSEEDEYSKAELLLIYETALRLKQERVKSPDC